MAKKEFVVADPAGFHARPATALVQAASKHSCDVNIIYNDNSVNAKSIMGVMSLGIGSGQKFELEADEAALESLEKSLKDNKII